MLRFGLGIALAVFILDQGTKYLILEIVMQPPRVIEVTDFFNLVMVWNRGVSFGLLSNDSPYGPWLLAALAIGISTVLVFWLRKAETRFLATSLGLVIGGAIGNVIDRVRFGAVADFLDFHALGYHYPAFNVADSAIVVGVLLILLEGFFVEHPAQRAR